MDYTNIFFKTLVESVIGALLLALLLSLYKDISFVQALMLPSSIAVVGAGFAGGLIGNMRRAKKQLQANS